MQTFQLMNRFTEVTTIYLLVLLISYFLKPDYFALMTTRTSSRPWSEIQNLFRDSPRSVAWEDIAVPGWCPSGNHSSPQCGCFQRYYQNTYLPSNLTWNGTSKALADKHSVGILESCLRYRPSWKKETCGEFCKLHFLTPLILCCVYLITCYSKIIVYKERAFVIIYRYMPVFLSLVTAVCILVNERSGGVIACLSILSVLLETNYLSSFTFEGQVFWSYHRFFTTALAVQVALLNDSRDLIQVFSYGLLGFFTGLLSYMIYLVRLGIQCKHDTNVCLHLWLGTCAILSCFIFLIQQSWNENSRLKSSSVYSLCLIITCVQSVIQTPYIWVPTEVHVCINFVVLSICFVFTVSDLFQ